MARLLCILTLAVAIFLPPAQRARGQDCPPDALARPKNSLLYLYFPTSADSAFPKWSTYGTSPLAAFDVADLDSTIGTTAQLRNRILELVTQDYCEFSVRVTLTWCQ